ncbi:hypothetical protein [Burkholderia sp. Ap-962]|nr:hypothetical protein [Burkholderia sp. Ap-962]
MMIIALSHALHAHEVRVDEQLVLAVLAKHDETIAARNAERLHQ